jgi:hypothetical protein
MAKVQFVVEAHYEWGGDEVGTFDTLAAATKAAHDYIEDLERDAATGEEIEPPQSITLMTQVDECDVPTQAATWVFSANDWTNHPTAEDILSDYGDGSGYPSDKYEQA